MGGVCLGYVSGHEAARRIREGRARVACATRRQLKAITMLHAAVSAEIPRSPALHYREEFGGHTVWALKRYRESDGTWHNCDNTLTFAEYRVGRIKSAETIARQRDERALRAVSA